MTGDEVDIAAERRDAETAALVAAECGATPNGVRYALRFLSETGRVKRAEPPPGPRGGVRGAAHYWELAGRD